MGDQSPKASKSRLSMGAKGGALAPGEEVYIEMMKTELMESAGLAAAAATKMLREQWKVLSADEQKVRAPLQ